MTSLYPSLEAGLLPGPGGGGGNHILGRFSVLWGVGAEQEGFVPQADFDALLAALQAQGQHQVPYELKGDSG